jgi:hypothetical protein
MQDRGYELPRIPLPRTPVNKHRAARHASLGVTMHSAMVALPATGGIPLLELLLLIGGALLLGMGVLLYALLRRRV